MKKVLLIIAYRNFQPFEYSMPKGILEAAGLEVITASDQAGMAVSSVSETEAKVDILLTEVEVKNYAGIYFIGGPGALEHLDNEMSYKIAQDARQTGMAFGAICISPRILAKAGVLKGRKATGWNDDGELAKILENGGAQYVRDPVVVDDNLITAVGPTAAEEFGNKIVELLK